MFKVGDGSLSHNLAVNLDDEIQEIFAELEESGDHFRDEDFDVTDTESMNEMFEGIDKGVANVYKSKEGYALKNELLYNF